MENKPDLSSTLKEKLNLQTVPEESNSKKSVKTKSNNDSKSYTDTKSFNESYASAKSNPILEEEEGYIPENIVEKAQNKNSPSEKFEQKKTLEKRDTIVIDVADKKKSVVLEKRFTLAADKIPTLGDDKNNLKESMLENSAKPLETASGNVIMKKAPIRLTQAEFAKKRSELGYIEYLLSQTYKFYLIILCISLVFGISSSVGIIIISLRPPFDSALIPLSIYMGFLSVILSIIISAKKKYNISNHLLGWRFLLYCLMGNLIALIYLTTKVVDLYPSGSESIATFVFASGYLIIFTLIEIIMLFFLYPESDKLLKHMEIRETLIEELYETAINSSV